MDSKNLQHVVQESGKSRLRGPVDLTTLLIPDVAGIEPKSAYFTLTETAELPAFPRFEMR
jgi:hypothetical protein